MWLARSLIRASSRISLRHRPAAHAFRFSCSSLTFNAEPLLPDYTDAEHQQQQPPLEDEPVTAARALPPSSVMDSVVEVTRENFDAVLPIVQQAIDAAAFIAIDAEFTGLHTHPSLKAVSLDTLDVRYCKLRNSAANFQMLQYGICAFSFDAARGAFVAKPFSFFLHPLATPVGVDTVGGADTVGTTSSSALTFLSRNHYDFNRTFAVGLGWLSREAEAAIRAERRAEAVWKLRRSFAPEEEKPAAAAGVGAAGGGSASQDATSAAAAANAPARVLLLPTPEGVAAPRPQDLTIRSPPDVEWYNATVNALRAWLGAVRAWEDAVAAAASGGGGGASSDGVGAAAAAAAALAPLAAGPSGPGTPGKWGELRGIETAPAGEMFPHLVFPAANGYRRRAIYTIVRELLDDGGAGLWDGSSLHPSSSSSTNGSGAAAASADSAAPSAPALAPSPPPRYATPPLLCWKRAGDQRDVKGDWNARLRLTWVGGSAARAAAFTTYETDRALAEVDAMVSAAVGFRRVVDSITARGCLVVGHNCQLDFSHSTAKFLGQESGSPPSVDQWAASLLQLFPGGVYDTKQLVVAGPLASAFGSKNGLSEAFGVVQRNRVEWVLPPQPPPPQQVPAAAAPPSAPVAQSNGAAAVAGAATAASAADAGAPAANSNNNNQSRYRKRERPEDAAIVVLDFAALVPVIVQNAAVVASAAAAASASAASVNSSSSAAAASLPLVLLESASALGVTDASMPLEAGAPSPSIQVAGLSISSPPQEASAAAGAGGSIAPPTGAPAAPAPRPPGAALTAPEQDLTLGFDNFAHDAGADAAMTGVLFLRCAALLAAKLHPAAPAAAGGAGGGGDAAAGGSGGGGGGPEGRPSKRVPQAKEARSSNGGSGAEAVSASSAAEASAAAAAAPSGSPVDGAASGDASAAAPAATPAISVPAVSTPSMLSEALRGSSPVVPTPTAAAAASPPVSTPAAASKSSGSGGSSGTVTLEPVPLAELNRILLEELERRSSGGRGEAVSSAAAAVGIGIGSGGSDTSAAVASAAPAAPAPTLITHLAALRAARSQLHQMRITAPEARVLNVEDAAEVWAAAQQARAAQAQVLRSRRGHSTGARPVAAAEGAVSVSSSNSLLAARAVADCSALLAVEGVNKCIDSELIVTAIASAAGIAPRMIDKNRGVIWVDDRSLFVVLPSHMHVEAVVEAWAAAEAADAAAAAAASAADAAAASDADAMMLMHEEGEGGVLRDAAPVAVLGAVRSPSSGAEGGGGGGHGGEGSADEKMAIPAEDLDGATNGNNMLGLGLSFGSAAAVAVDASASAPSATSSAASAADAAASASTAASPPVAPVDEYAAWVKPKVRVESFLTFLRRNAAVYGTVCDNDALPKRMVPASGAAAGGAGGALVPGGGGGGGASAAGAVGSGGGGKGCGADSAAQSGGAGEAGKSRGCAVQ